MSRVSSFCVCFALGAVLSAQQGHASASQPDKNLSKTQVLNVGVGADLPTLDPQKMEDNVSARVGHDLYEPLMTEDADGNIIPGIAQKYTVSTSGLTYDFELRPNAKFSNGAAITADDVVFTFQRLVNPKVASTYAYVAGDIKNAKAVNEGKLPLQELGVKATAPNHVQITLDRPIPYFLKIIVMANFGVVQKENIEKFGDTFAQPGNLVSSGAYQLTYWKVGDKATSKKNPHYWNAKNVHIQEVNYFPLSDVNSEFQMYQSGQIDVTYDISSDRFKKLKESMPADIHANPYLSIYYLDLNNAVLPFKGNLKLRKALSLALDRKVLTKYVTGRGEAPAYDIVPVGTADYIQQNYDWNNEPYPTMLAQAQKLYEESGFSADKPLEVTISYNTNVLHKKVMIAVAAMWTKAFAKQGLKVNLLNQEWKVFLKTRQQGDYQIARDGWIADYNDVSSFADLFKTGNPQNNSHYSNPKYDEQMALAASEMNPKNRQEIVQNAVKMMLDDYPVIPLYAYVTTHLVKGNVGGFSDKNPLDHQYSRTFYLLDASQNAAGAQNTAEH